jgi:hypothetical protein
MAKSATVFPCALLMVLISAVSSNGQSQPPVGDRIASAGTWYCSNPAGFYPDLTACNVAWQFESDSSSYLDLDPGAGGPRVSANVYPGYRIARNVCLPCHIIFPNQGRRPVLPNPGPSFAEIANRPGMSYQSLSAFIATRGWDMARSIRMRSGDYSDRSAQEVASYIMSLRVSR